MKKHSFRSFVAGIICALGLVFVIWGIFNHSKFFKNFVKNYNQTPTQSTPQEYQTKAPIEQEQSHTTIMQGNDKQPKESEQSLNHSAKPSHEDLIFEDTVSKGKLSALNGAGGREHLVRVPDGLTQKPELVHRSVYNPMLAMIQSAAQDGVRLSVVSAFRSYEHQKSIWERKWGNTPNDSVDKAYEILRWSSFPGTSRHHWGTDIDFNSVSTAYWQGAEGKKVHRWLTQNAPSFGFCQTYAPGRPKGYSDEPWHWSHMPTAQSYYVQMQQPSAIQTVISQPVKGAAAMQKIAHELNDYITGIKSCAYSDNAPMPTQSTFTQGASKARPAQKQPVQDITRQDNTSLQFNPSNTMPKIEPPTETQPKLEISDAQTISGITPQGGTYNISRPSAP